MAVSTNVPWRRVLPVVFSVFCYFFNVHVVMPFLPFMTKSFLDPPRNEIGYYAGLLASAFFIGDFIGSVVWGRVADRTGRRKVMLLSPGLTVGMVLAFGLSQSFWWAVLTRLVWGFTASVVSVAKTILADLSTDGNQARLFALMGVGNGLARLMAPALGGLLSRPARKFSAFDISAFRTFPYLLPCLIGAGLSVANVLVNFLYLKETMKVEERTAPDEANSLVVSAEDVQTAVSLQAVSNNSCNQSETVHMVVLTGDATADDSILDNVPLGSCSDAQSSSSDTERTSNFPDVGAGILSRIRYAGKPAYRPLNSTWGAVRRHFQAYRLLKSPTISRPIVCYSLLAFASMVVFEVVPLILLNNAAHGGFCLNSAELGIIYAAAGVVQLLNQLFIYPRLARRFGFRRLFRMLLLIFSCTAILLPWSVNILGSQDPSVERWTNLTSVSECVVLSLPVRSDRVAFTSNVNDTMLSRVHHTSSTALPTVSSRAFVSVMAAVDTHPGECHSSRLVGNGTAGMEKDLQNEFSLVSCIPWWVYVALVGFCVPLTLSIIMSFTSSNIMVNNSCTADVRATVNGISQSFASVGRFIGPLLSMLFAWSTDSNLPFPLNYHLVFWLVAGINMTNILFSRKLTSVVEQRQTEEVVQSAYAEEEQAGLLSSAGSKEEDTPTSSYSV